MNHKILMIAAFFCTIIFKMCTDGYMDRVKDGLTPVADEIDGNHTYRLKLVTNDSSNVGYNAELYEGKRYVGLVKVDSASELHKVIKYDNR